MLALNRRVRDIPLVLESLEPRCLMTVFGAGAGAYFDGTYLTPYSLEATVADSGAVDGSLRFADSGGAGPGQELTVESVAFLPGGRYIPKFRSSFSPYQKVTGSEFVNGASYPIGWFAGVDAGYSRAEFTLLTERADDLAKSDLGGSWRYQSLIVKIGRAHV